MPARPPLFLRCMVRKVKCVHTLAITALPFTGQAHLLAARGAHGTITANSSKQLSAVWTLPGTSMRAASVLARTWGLRSREPSNSQEVRQEEEFSKLSWPHGTLNPKPNTLKALNPKLQAQNPLNTEIRSSPETAAGRFGRWSPGSARRTGSPRTQPAEDPHLGVDFNSPQIFCDQGSILNSITIVRIIIITSQMFFIIRAVQVTVLNS